MVLDIAIAMFAKNHQMQGDAPRPVPLFRRARTSITPLSRTTPLDRIAKHMRYTAFKTHEQHTKQVQMLINNGSLHRMRPGDPSTIVCGGAMC